MNSKKKLTKASKEFMVIGIGASAGGLNAIQELFDHIPPNTGFTFVIIQHLSPDFKSLMPELLAKHTEMKIFTAEDNQTIKPNCIYLNQRNKNLEIKEDKLLLLDKEPKNNLNLPIDIFFHALGEQYKNKSVGIILSGTGSDGSRGIKTIKEAGGTIIVQDPDSGQFDGMPNSAIATNLVDFIQTPTKIAKTIKNLPNSPILFSYIDDRLEYNQTYFYKILDEIYKFCGIDFSKYKNNTLLRRLEKRLIFSNSNNLSEYLDYLKKDLKEKEILKDDFLIGVSSFFRDRKAFDSLKNNVIPAICYEKSNQPNNTIRIWVPGCSSGEEAFSIAILFDNFIRKNGLNLDFKIFATDANSQAIDFASQGSYHINTSFEVGEYFLEKYFLVKDEKIQIKKYIREKIIFSTHNILSDPPFIRVDLISCRNMLIYLNSKAQENIFLNFQFGLRLHGYLFLGSSESLGRTEKLFKTIDSKWKIFQNISESKRIPSDTNPEHHIVLPVQNKTTRPNLITKLITKETPEGKYHKYLSSKYSPDSIFFDREHNILFIKGNAGKKLIHHEGVFKTNLLKMVTPQIATIIRNAVKRLDANSTKDILYKDVIKEINGKVFSYDLSFHKLVNTSEFSDVYMLQFSKDKVVEETKNIDLSNLLSNNISEQQIEDLESELKITKTKLQNAVEELETSNEELQSSNEELMASNEELQSTNEELQSVNEELYTVNSELQEKNVELKLLNNDINNLLNATDIGTLFLDNNLCIRKYTPALQKHFSIEESDLGRPISSFTSTFSEKTRLSIIDNAKLVMKKLIGIEKEIKDIDGVSFLKKIVPFLTDDKKIDGVIISFTDLTNIKNVEQKITDSQKRYKALFDNMNEGFVHGRIIKNKNDWEYLNINSSFEKLTGLKSENILFTKASSNKKFNFSENLDKITHTALTGEKQSLETFFSSINKSFSINLFSPKKGEFAMTLTDITDRKEKEKVLLKTQNHLNQAQELSKVGSWFLDLKTNKVTWTKKMYEIYGFDPNLPAPSLNETKKIITDESWKILIDALENTQKTGEGYDIELQIIKKDGSLGWLKSLAQTNKDSNGNVISLWGSAQDITESKNLFKKLNYEKQFSQKITESSSSGIYIYNLNKGTNTYMNSQYKKLLGYTMQEINDLGFEKFMNLFHPNDKKNIEKHMQEVLSGKDHCKIEYRFKHKKGHWVWCYSIDSPFEYDEKGNIISFVGIFIDISEKKEYETQLQENIEKVKLSNNELSQFAYIASHDLQEPLVNIKGLVEMFAKKYENKIDDQGNLFIENILRSSDRMHSLIKGILEYSRLDNDIKSLLFSPTKIIDEIIDDLSSSIDEKKAIININAFPNEIKGYKINVRLLFQNLISNAIKYNKSTPPKIEISYTEDDNYHIFNVKDNGIGIEEKHYKKVFEIFKRLHSNTVYKGTGIGLSQSKKIVSKHKGEIWIEPNNNKQGSNFIFTLSKNLK